MSETLFPVGPVDLEALDLFLMSDASPEDCMQLSDLDGFLTGIAIAPHTALAAAARRPEAVPGRRAPARRTPCGAPTWTASGPGGRSGPSRSCRASGCRRS